MTTIYTDKRLKQEDHNHTWIFLGKVKHPEYDIEGYNLMCSVCCVKVIHVPDFTDEEHFKETWDVLLKFKDPLDFVQGKTIKEWRKFKK